MQHSKYKVKRPLRTIPGNVTVYEAEQTVLKRGVEIRVLNQFVEVKGEPMHGLLHSDQLRTVERISFDASKNDQRPCVYDDSLSHSSGMPLLRLRPPVGGC